MKIKVYKFEWLDKETNCEYKAVKIGKFGETWKKDFEEDNRIRFDCKIKETEIELKAGVKLITKDLEINIDNIWEDETISITSIERWNDCGIFNYCVSKELFEEYLNRMVDFGESELEVA